MMMLLILGVVPALLLMGYVYRLDRIEPEPWGLLLRLFIYGGLTTFAAGILEEIGVFALSLFLDNPYSQAFLVLENFLVVGLAEEGVKHYALRKTTWYHSAFNYRFDGIVYSVAVALGFDAFENVMYILNFGLGVAPVRAVTAIPMHAICGIYMGHLYGQAKYHEAMRDWGAMTAYQWASVIIPLLLHGFYDFAASSDSPLLSGLFLLYVVVIDIVSFILLKHYSKTDTNV